VTKVVSLLPSQLPYVFTTSHHIDVQVLSNQVGVVDNTEHRDFIHGPFVGTG